MRAKKVTDSDEVPILPRFPSAAYDVVVTFYDGSIEVIKVMARGKAAAIQVACYTMSKWADDKIPNIAAVSFNDTPKRNSMDELNSLDAKNISAIGTEDIAAAVES